MPPASDTGPEVVVRAIRQRNPDAWTYVLDALALAEHGFSDAEAMENLAAAVRVKVRDLLGPEAEDDPRRALAQQLARVDAQGRLEDVLNDALVLDDERVERLLREQDE